MQVSANHRNAGHTHTEDAALHCTNATQHAAHADNAASVFATHDAHGAPLHPTHTLQLRDERNPERGWRLVPRMAGGAPTALDDARAFVATELARVAVHADESVSRRYLRNDDAPAFAFTLCAGNDIIGYADDADGALQCASQHARDNDTQVNVRSTRSGTLLALCDAGTGEVHTRPMAGGATDDAFDTDEDTFDIETRLPSVIERATDAFFAEVARAYPEITTGDVDPLSAYRWDEFTTDHVRSFIRGNMHDARAAGTRDDNATQRRTGDMYEHALTREQKQAAFERAIPAHTRVELPDADAPDNARRASVRITSVALDVLVNLDTREVERIECDLMSAEPTAVYAVPERLVDGLALEATREDADEAFAIEDEWLRHNAARVSTTLYGIVRAAVEDVCVVADAGDSDLYTRRYRVSRDGGATVRVFDNFDDADAYAGEDAEVDEIVTPRARVGMRVRTNGVVERFPHFSIPDGKLGTVSEVNTDDARGGALVAVTMDENVPGAEEWDNAVLLSAEDDDASCIPDGVNDPTRALWRDFVRVDDDTPPAHDDRVTMTQPQREEVARIMFDGFDEVAVEHVTVRPATQRDLDVLRTMHAMEDGINLRGAVAVESVTHDSCQHDCVAVIAANGKSAGTEIQ